MSRREASACPRCMATPDRVRLEHSARADGVPLWSVLHCTRCAFTWRTTEPPRSIDPEHREAWTQMKSTDPADYRSNIPPAK